MGVEINKKEKTIMVDIEKINAEIERLKTLNADEYLAEAIAKLKADFEESRAEKIAELEKALEIFAQYQVVEEQVEENGEEQVEEAQIVEE